MSPSLNRPLKQPQISLLSLRLPSRTFGSKLLVSLLVFHPGLGGMNDMNGDQPWNRMTYLSEIHPEATTEDVCNAISGGVLQSVSTWMISTSQCVLPLSCLGPS